MATASESRAALTLVSSAAITAARRLLSGGATRGDLLDAVPEVIAYYSLGSSALAADFYDDERERSGVRGLFLAEPVIPDRGEKIGRAVAWATELLDEDELTTSSRLAEVISLETARPYRDTITENSRRDPQNVGWRRIAGAGSCKLCRMLADRGAVYRESTARFAAHTSCHCTAQPVFRGQPGEEASVMQYAASKRRTTQRDRDRLRNYLNEHYPDAHG